MATEAAVSRRMRVLVAVLGVGLLSAIAGWATYSAFTATTTSTGNRIAMGEVAIGDNDSSTFMYNESNVLPGEQIERCIAVTYTGTLDAEVRLYGTPVGDLGPHVDLTVTPGSGTTTFPGCTGFTADASGPLFQGTLAAFSTTHMDWTTGLTDVPNGASMWQGGETVVYRFLLSVHADAGQGLDTGTHGFTWEARS